MGGLGTRAAMLFGATAVVAACSSEGSQIAVYGAPAPDVTADAGGDADADAGAVVAMYGAPAPDASATDSGAADAATDAASPEGGPVPAYGGPSPGN